jgi:hypothetical protein
MREVATIGAHAFFLPGKLVRITRRLSKDGQANWQLDMNKRSHPQFPAR